MQVDPQNTPSPARPRSCALISVSDKTGLEILGKRLVDADFELIATTSTSQYLASFDIKSRTIKF